VVGASIEMADQISIDLEAFNVVWSIFICHIICLGASFLENIF
jgi:hypothetical protein